MNPKPISPDLAEDLRNAGTEPLSYVDDDQHVYVLVDLDTHQRAMKALRYQQNVESIRRGVADMEAGRGMSIDESQRRTEEALRQHASQ